jgi:hypothetical protein
LLRAQNALIVLVYDKDQLSNDDLIGCVTVKLGELHNGVLDGWRKITRPPNAPKREFFVFAAKEGELKVRASLTRSLLLEDPATNSGEDVETDVDDSGMGDGVSNPQRQGFQDSPSRISNGKARASSAGDGDQTRTSPSLTGSPPSILRARPNKTLTGRLGISDL